MPSSARGTSTGDPPRRRPGRPRLTEPSPDHLQRLDEIIETGIKVFHERGYDSGSLDDVAAALDLRKASLYHYLRSKAQLLYLIFDRALSTALRRLDELSDVGDSRQQLARLIVHQVRMVGNEPGMFAVFFDQRPRLDDSFHEQVTLKEREYVRRITAMVTRATESGELGDVDPRHAAHALIGMTSWIYKWLDPSHDDTDQVARTMIKLILGDEVDADEALASLPAPDTGTHSTVSDSRV
jgi:AcrR family transcriptional regulator